MIIAIGHRSGVGKDTAAKMLVSMLRLSGKWREVQKISFAKPLKDAAHVIWGCYGLKPGEHYEEHPECKDDILPIIDKSARQLWIDLGQHVRSIYANSWRDAALGHDDHDKVVVIADMRFTNEFEGVRSKDGLCIKLDSTRGTWHASDHELKDRNDWDCYINNDGGKTQLHDRLAALMVAEGLI